MIMTLKEFAKMLDGREYLHEITKEEEALAKELGFVVVFGYSDDNAELRGAIDDEIGCYDGGVLEHDGLPSVIYADWCPKDIDCSWAYDTSITHENFNIYEDGELYCVGIVCDINKSKKTNADRIRSMSDEELAEFLTHINPINCQNCAFSHGWRCQPDRDDYSDFEKCKEGRKRWLQQPAE